MRWCIQEVGEGNEKEKKKKKQVKKYDESKLKANSVLQTMYHSTDYQLDSSAADTERCATFTGVTYPVLDKVGIASPPRCIVSPRIKGPGDATW